MEFGQLMADILVYVSCKFETNIFEIAQVIGENVPIAFLYVLSIVNYFYLSPNIFFNMFLFVTQCTIWTVFHLCKLV